MAYNRHEVAFAALHADGKRAFLRALDGPHCLTFTHTVAGLSSQDRRVEGNQGNEGKEKDENKMMKDRRTGEDRRRSENRRRMDQKIKRRIQDLHLSFLIVKERMQEKTPMIGVCARAHIFWKVETPPLLGHPTPRYPIE
eukprot:scaffold1239_cov175-Pinguiococcus_pyrenoidosus.AAC.27